MCGSIPTAIVRPSFFLTILNVGVNLNRLCHRLRTDQLMSSRMGNLPTSLMSFVLSWAIDTIADWRALRLVSVSFCKACLQPEAQGGVELSVRRNPLAQRDRSNPAFEVPSVSTDQFLLAMCPVLRGLRGLCLRQRDSIHSRGTDVTDLGLAALSSLVALQTLDLSRSWKISNAGLASLSSLSVLHSLNLNQCGVHDVGVALLSSLTALRTLRLAGWCEEDEWDVATQSYLGLNDAGVASLCALTNLCSLELSCRAFTDVGVASLSSLINLHTLNLSGCNYITDEGLASLSPLRKLRNLDLCDCTGITTQGIASLSLASKGPGLDFSCRCSFDEQVDDR